MAVDEGRPDHVVEQSSGFLQEKGHLEIYAIQTWKEQRIQSNVGH